MAFVSGYDASGWRYGVTVSSYDALGLQAAFPHPHPWAADCLFWLKQQGFVN